MTAVPDVSYRPLHSPARPRAAAEHIPALDGIRGLAILMVFYHHLTLQSGVTLLEDWARLAELGLSGVDLFFVLSGFLITGILLENKDQPHYFRNFYARRTLRIFPLYYVVVFGALVVLPRLPVGELDKIRDPQDAWSYWLYLSNISMALGDGFRHAVLDVTWSLAIEEQFYLVWPLVVLLVPRQALVKFCLALLAAGLLLRFGLVVNGARWQTTFLLTPCRMDGLLVGAMIAVAFRQPGVIDLRRIAVGIGATCTTMFLLVLTQGAHFFQTRVGQVLSPLLLAGMYGSLLVLVLRSADSSLLNRGVSQPLLRLFGKYSYAL